MAVLENYDIEYLIVGGIAVGFHSEPRFTKDLDVLVSVNPASSERLLQALREFGAPVLAMTAEEFLVEDFVFFIGVPPWRIDILTSIPGVDFAQAYKDKIQVELGGAEVDCISREWLIKAKRASGRHQDLADLEALVAEVREPPDA